MIEITISNQQKLLDNINDEKLYIEFATRTIKDDIFSGQYTTYASMDRILFYNFKLNKITEEPIFGETFHIGLFNIKKLSRSAAFKKLFSECKNSGISKDQIAFIQKNISTKIIKATDLINDNQNELDSYLLTVGYVDPALLTNKSKNRIYNYKLYINKSKKYLGVIPKILENDFRTRYLPELFEFINAKDFNTKYSTQNDFPGEYHINKAALIAYFGSANQQLTYLEESKDKLLRFDSDPLTSYLKNLDVSHFSDDEINRLTEFLNSILKKHNIHLFFEFKIYKILPDLKYNESISITEIMFKKLFKEEFFSVLTILTVDEFYLIKFLGSDLRISTQELEILEFSIKNNLYITYQHNMLEKIGLQLNTIKSYADQGKDIIGEKEYNYLITKLESANKIHLELMKRAGK